MQSSVLREGVLNCGVPTISSPLQLPSPEFPSDPSLHNIKQDHELSFTEPELLFTHKYKGVRRGATEIAAKCLTLTGQASDLSFY